MRRLFTIFILSIYSGFILSQNPLEEFSLSLPEIIELLSEQAEDDVDQEELSDAVYQLNSSPVDVNSGQYARLQELNLLNPEQVRNLKLYLNRVGEIQSLYELQLIPSFDLRTIKIILPFLYVNSAEVNDGLRRIRFKYSHGALSTRINSVLERQDGYLPVPDSLRGIDSYLGNRLSVSTRLRYTISKQIQIGYTAEKDPGEEFFSGSNRNGFDHNSAYVHIKDLGVISSLVVGDYSLRFGQGLSLWSGFASGFSLQSASSVKRFHQNVRPYGSVNEFNYFRGIGASFSKGILSFSPFYSNKWVDANVILADSLSVFSDSVSSTPESGIHATLTQIEKQKKLHEIISGANLVLNLDKLSLGFTGMYLQYALPVIKGDNPDDLYDFSGRESSNFSMDYQYSLYGIHLFGELGVNEKLKPGTINGVFIPVSSSLNISVLCRNYQPGFYALKGNAYAANSSATNESGTYFGLDYSILKNVKLNAFFDLYRFPWLSYYSESPATGQKSGVQGVWDISEQLEFLFQFRETNRQESVNDENTPISKNIRYKKQSYRFQCTLIPNKSLKIQSRLELNSIDFEDKENGTLFYVNVKYSLSPQLQLISRFALFDTDSYSSRIYAYEDDVLYSYSFPAYYYKGSRTYFLIKYKPGSHIDLSLRISQSVYNNRQNIGSDLNLIRTNTKSEIHLFARLKF